MEAATQTSSAQAAGRDFSSVLRGLSHPLNTGEAGSWRRDLFYVLGIALGSGLYGAMMGWWHSPAQAVYVAEKFPIIMLATAFGNGLLNGMLASLLGLNISFRQSLTAVLMSYAISSAILASFSPIVGFFVWSAPANQNTAASDLMYSVLMLAHVAIIAFAGVVGNARLHQALVGLGGDMPAATRVLYAWLGTNFLLGSQLSWILRPFIGAPGRPVQFVRPDAFHGNFFEAVGHSLIRLWHQH